MDNFNMEYWYEESILNQTYQMQIFSDFYHEDLKC